MLKELRASKGLSQKELSDLTGINIRTLQSYEQGARDINEASLSTLTSLAIALGCDINALLTDETLISQCEKTLL